MEDAISALNQEEIVVNEKDELPSPLSVHIRHDKRKKFFTNATSAKISVKEFFDFVKTAYQVNESIEQLIPELLVDEQSGVNWNNFANNELVNQLMGSGNSKNNDNENVLIKVETECQTDSKINCNENECDNDNLLNGKNKSSTSVTSKSTKIKQDESKDNLSLTDDKKLSTTKIYEVMKETISEGTKNEKNNPSQTSLGSTKNTSTKSNGNKKDDETQSKTSLTNAEPEVEIHVCDEVKHLKKDFHCPQKLLTSKMGYFAEITAGQKLEDIDISVHCDIGIFDWLMRWTKKEMCLPEDWPRLEPVCVAPILVSAVFLQMEPLIEECLLYCHKYMNEILKTSTNLSCLNDIIITRLAAMYTNSELENIKDKKDKILSRLYCKLILSLGEPVPQSIRGHWASLAGIYKCCKCNKLVTSHDGPDIPCVPSCMQVSLNGDIISEHVRDINWNLSEYIVELYKELKTWRKVYWRLWSVCHFLRCVECLTLFPVHQMSWCCRHPEQPQFFISEGQRTTAIPVGRYPCCGARTYRFEVLTNTTQGCQFREHVPDVKNPRDLAILSLFNHHRNVIEQPPPEIMIPEKLTKLVARDATSECRLFDNKEVLWWEGIELAPARERLGLLGKMSFGGRNIQQSESPSYSIDSSSDYSSDEEDLDDSDSSSNSHESEVDITVSNFKIKRYVSQQRKLRRRKQRGNDCASGGRHWSPTLSARSNQDIQRDFEENAMQQVIEFLTRRTNNNVVGTTTNFQRLSMNNKIHYANIWNHHIIPTGGIYQRLEAEWCENNRQPVPSYHSTKHFKSATTSFIMKPKFRTNNRNDIK